jgi:hypothetical protein
LTLTKPWEHRCLFVVLPTRLEGFSGRAIALPGDVDAESMAAFEAMKPTGGARATFSLHDVPASERLGETTSKNLMHDRWRKACQVGGREEF